MKLYFDQLTKNLAEKMKAYSLILLMSCVGIALSFTVQWRDIVANNNLMGTESDHEKKSGKEEVKHWALIVAGSNTWYNYRHQADVCHAYQVIHSHGIPDEQIVVMMYDDIANNPQNPDKGIIINHPKGSDVYKGVPKDYTGTDVTPQNFLNVLSGNQSALLGTGSGKVIASGPNDNVFVYFADHGAPGLIAFPTEELHANQLLKTLQDMYTAKRYNKLVFYLEACESGSMFDDLPADINIYATTASNDHESSYACYYDNHVGTYLGDVYSIKWLEDSDSEDLSKETLRKQFKIVKEETNTSHVLQFGNKTMGHDKVNMYQGQGGGKARSVAALPTVPLNAVPSPEVPMAILHHQMRDATTPEEINRIQQQIKDMKQHHDKITTTVQNIVKSVVADNGAIDRIMMTKGTSINTWECYEPIAKQFSQKCFTLGQNPHAMTQMYIFVNLCEEGIKPEIIASAMDHHCKQ